MQKRVSPFTWLFGYLLRQMSVRCRRKHGVTKLKSLGGFKNNRKVYEWKGETIELDETMYDWGTCYEIELETVRQCSAS